MARRISIIAVALVGFATWWGAALDNAPRASASSSSREDLVRLPLANSAFKAVLGPTAVVSEMESGLEFAARVDTGAKTCSIHADGLSVIGGSDGMQENVGKLIRFRIANRDGESMWLERPIAEVSFIKSSNGAEWRYMVAMTLVCEGVEKQVLVSLNDRSAMGYAMLVGRNLLAREFLVDVGTGE